MAHAIGAKADGVETSFVAAASLYTVPIRFPLDQLPSLLLAADVHLITLRDAFVGYVLPSKVHACIESGKRIIFVGNERSDVHLLASGALSSLEYLRVEVGDIDGLVKGLHNMEKAIIGERYLRPQKAEPTRIELAARAKN